MLDEWSVGPKATHTLLPQSEVNQLQQSTDDRSWLVALIIHLLTV
jgi:hypothetical protein